MYRYLLFDLDGTLTNSEEGITKSIDHALRQVVGIETADLTTLRPYIGPSLQDGFMEHHKLDYETARQCKYAYRERFSTVGLYENSVYEGIPHALELLRDTGRKLVVATAKPQVFAKRILDHFDLSQYFAAICGSTLDEKVNKKEQVIALALEVLDNPPAEEVIMVGDRRHDVHGAAVHGIETLGVLYGFGGMEELTKAGACATAETVEEMTAWLLAH